MKPSILRKAYLKATKWSQRLRNGIEDATGEKSEREEIVLYAFGGLGADIVLSSVASRYTDSKVFDYDIINKVLEELSLPIYTLEKGNLSIIAG
jgi:hypothetical protein